MAASHLSLDLSDRPRVLVAGDVHGEFGKLSKALANLRFDPKKDALILAGDLVDRGPSSLAALEWAKKPGIYRVLGNHDEMSGMIMRCEMSKGLYRGWGGGWFLDLPSEEQAAVAAALGDAPIAITVKTPGGRRVGVVHADCMSDWDEHVAALAPNSPSQDRAANMSLWTRATINDILRRQADQQPVHDGWARVANIDHVFHGHTILPEPFTLANRTWIDTGAYQGGPLTVVDMDAWVEAHPDDGKIK